jgi:hypothetical protein
MNTPKPMFVREVARIDDPALRHRIERNPIPAKRRKSHEH